MHLVHTQVISVLDQAMRQQIMKELRTLLRVLPALAPNHEFDDGRSAAEDQRAIITSASSSSSASFSVPASLPAASPSHDHALPIVRLVGAYYDPADYKIGIAMQVC